MTEGADGGREERKEDGSETSGSQRGRGSKQSGRDVNFRVVARERESGRQGQKK